MCLLLSSLSRYNAVSVVFDFNVSLNDVPPLSPMLFPVCMKRKDNNELLMDVICASSFIRLHKSG